MMWLGLCLAAVAFGVWAWSAWKWRKLRKMLDTIPRMEADILWARLRHRKTFEEIGNEMGKCRQLIHYRYDRGMQRITWLREHPHG